MERFASAEQGLVDHQGLGPIRVVVTRGDIVESRHGVRHVVAHADGSVLSSIGDVHEPVFMRSSAKPLICAAVVESGAAEHFRFTGQELAVASGSHAGEPHHVDAVRSMLHKIGLGEDALQCGPHPPLNPAAAASLAAAHRAPQPIHNNCSGKHAAILALVQYLHASADDYLSPENPAQRRILQGCAELLDIDLKSAPIGVDGCGVPVIAVPMIACATFYARLAEDERLPAKWRVAMNRVKHAMLEHAEFVGGVGRLDTDIMQATRSRLLCKSGAEGYHACTVFPEAIGMASKVEDGNNRATPPFVVDWLLGQGYISEEEAGALARHRFPDVLNHAGAIVGQIKATSGDD